MSKNTRNRILLTAIAALLLLAVTVGGTMAWLADTTAEVKNTFATTDINITLTEDLDEQEFDLIPGTTYEKNPVATVLKGSEPCYLYVEVVEAGTIEGVIEYDIAQGWTEVDKTGPKDGIVYVWESAIDASAADVAKYILKGNETYANGIVSIPDTLEDETMNDNEDFVAPTLTFYAYAIQSANTGNATAAWGLLETQKGLN